MFFYVPGECPGIPAPDTPSGIVIGFVFLANCVIIVENICSKDIQGYPEQNNRKNEY